MKKSGKKNGVERHFFPHGTKHSKGVCILINPTALIQVNYSYSDNSGRIVLITISLSGHKLTLCNIYAPNNLPWCQRVFFSLGATELSGEASKGSREAARKKNLWYQRITTSLPCRLQFPLIDIRCQSLF